MDCIQINVVCKKQYQFPGLLSPANITVNMKDHSEGLVKALPNGSLFADPQVTHLAMIYAFRYTHGSIAKHGFVTSKQTKRKIKCHMITLVNCSFTAQSSSCNSCFMVMKPPPSVRDLYYHTLYSLIEISILLHQFLYQVQPKHLNHLSLCKLLNMTDCY